jgi:hypothetical protein
MSSFLIPLANLIIQTSLFSSSVGQYSPWKMRNFSVPLILLLSITLIINKPGIILSFFRMIIFSILGFPYFIIIIIIIIKDEVKYLTSWFDQWWVLFLAETKIMSSLLSNKFEPYAKNDSSPPLSAKFPRLLYFVVHYNIPWIMGWDYGISVGTSIKYITRKISIRWWEKFTYEPILQKSNKNLNLVTRTNSYFKKA